MVVYTAWHGHFDVPGPAQCAHMYKLCAHTHHIVVLWYSYFVNIYLICTIRGTDEVPALQARATTLASLKRKPEADPAHVGPVDGEHGNTANGLVTQSEYTVIYGYANGLAPLVCELNLPEVLGYLHSQRCWKIYITKDFVWLCIF